MSQQSLWQRILSFLESGSDAIRRAFEVRPATDCVAFSIAFIALAAKLAKADGTVTRDEVSMFRRIFEIPPEEEKNASRVYNLCRQDPTGYEVYAKQLSNALGPSETGDTLREDVLDGLFHIAMADNDYQAQEDAFLRRVAQIFGIEETAFLRLRARHVPELRDPWSVLGIEPSASMEELRTARSRFLRDNHPDRLVAKGLPKEMIELANARLADFNTAFEEVAESMARNQ